MELPAAFEEKMRALLQEEFDDYIACYKEPRYYGMRVNTGKISVEEFEKICPFEIKKIPWIENGFYYDGDKVSPAKLRTICRSLLSSGAKCHDTCEPPSGRTGRQGSGCMCSSGRKSDGIRSKITGRGSADR